MKKRVVSVLMIVVGLLAFSFGEDSPVVYFTSEITPESLMEIYAAMGWEPQGTVAVKLSTGEPPASNYLRPELIADLVRFVDGTIVECNTVYGGSRASTRMHYQVAKDHGFTAIAEVDIQDAEGSFTLPVSGGEVLTENYVGASFPTMTATLFFHISKGTAWQDSVGQSRIFPSDSLLPRVKRGFTAAAKAKQIRGEGIRLLLRKAWLKPENPFPIIWDTGSGLLIST